VNDRPPASHAPTVVAVTGSGPSLVVNVGEKVMLQLTLEVRSCDVTWNEDTLDAIVFAAPFTSRMKFDDSL